MNKEELIKKIKELGRGLREVEGEPSMLRQAFIEGFNECKQDVINLIKKCEI